MFPDLGACDRSWRPRSLPRIRILRGRQSSKGRSGHICRLCEHFQETERPMESSACEFTPRALAVRADSFRISCLRCRLAHAIKAKDEEILQCKTFIRERVSNVGDCATSAANPTYFIDVVLFYLPNLILLPYKSRTSPFLPSFYFGIDSYSRTCYDPVLPLLAYLGLHSQPPCFLQ